MDISAKLPPGIQELYKEGVAVKNETVELIRKWPLWRRNASLYDKLDDNFRSQVDEKIDDLRRWFNALKILILPHTLETESLLTNTLSSLINVLKNSTPQLSTEAMEKRVNVEMDRVLSLFKSVPVSYMNQPMASSAQQASYVRNTAFIMMWMNPMNSELDGVCNAIKEVCHNFGIEAKRSDDIEHQEKITDKVLQQITISEFLIADVTGERPNVYYEVGYAHALGKHPILYRRKGTQLHFDLSIHNIPEYENIPELKELLKRRFEAILGRAAQSS